MAKGMSSAGKRCKHLTAIASPLLSSDCVRAQNKWEARKFTERITSQLLCMILHLQEKRAARGLPLSGEAHPAFHMHRTYYVMLCWSPRSLTAYTAGDSLHTDTLNCGGCI